MGLQVRPPLSELCTLNSPPSTIRLFQKKPSRLCEQISGTPHYNSEHTSVLRQFLPHPIQFSPVLFGGPSASPFPLHERLGHGLLLQAPILVGRREVPVVFDRLGKLYPSGKKGYDFDGPFKTWVLKFNGVPRLDLGSGFYHLSVQTNFPRPTG